MNLLTEESRLAWLAWKASNLKDWRPGLDSPEWNMALASVLDTPELIETEDQTAFNLAVWEKVLALLRRGPAGEVRNFRNALRVLAGSWERPATPQTWEDMLVARGFEDVRIELLEHEAAVAIARRPHVRTAGARVPAGREASSGSRRAHCSNAPGGR